MSPESHKISKHRDFKFYWLLGTDLVEFLKEIKDDIQKGPDQHANIKKGPDQHANSRL